MAAIRPATHSGSWYAANRVQLQQQIEGWFNAVDSARFGRFGVGPHAGYAYCGSTLAHTYRCLDPAVTRVFVMGPSHYEYFKGVRTSRYAGYETPLGTVAVDTDITRHLNEVGVDYLTIGTDDEEHSVEMHLPMLHHALPKAKIVPLVFGDAVPGHERELVALLQPYFNDPKTAFVVSTDFCHWGSRFGYTQYAGAAGARLAPVKQHPSPLPRPIWESIRDLDEEAMKVATTGSSDKWRAYIKQTGNTVCGAVPLRVLLRLGEACETPLSLEWLDYAQSSHVSTRHESSVSYAAAIA